MPASRATVLRLVTHLPMSDAAALIQVDIDDWAIRKGCRYGTIVVDLDRHRIIDLLPDRTAPTMADWLSPSPRRGLPVRLEQRDRPDRRRHHDDQEPAPAKAGVAHVRLCHSRMLLVRACPRESQEMVFDAHDRAFAFFRGTCQRGIYDNMKTPVETIFVGRERAYNRRFLQMARTTSSSPWPARRRQAGRRGRWRTRSGWCASACSPRAFG